MSNNNLVSFYSMEHNWVNKSTFQSYPVNDTRNTWSVVLPSKKQPSNDIKLLAIKQEAETDQKDINNLYVGTISCYINFVKIQFKSAMRSWGLVSQVYALLSSSLIQSTEEIRMRRKKNQLGNQVWDYSQHGNGSVNYSMMHAQISQPKKKK